MLSKTMVCMLALVVTLNGQAGNEPVKKELNKNSWKVPLGKPIRLDGTIDKEEWARAKRIKAGNNGEILLVRDTKSLYIGILGKGPGMGSVYLQTKDKVLVLHSSGSLGTATYTAKGKHWECTSGFKWACRGRGMGKEEQRQRDDFFGKNGWVASIMPLGNPSHMEYRISLDLLQQSQGRVSVAYFFPRGFGPVSILRWPVTVSDGTIDIDLLCGKTDKTLAFSSQTWAKLDIKGQGSAEKIIPLAKLNRKFQLRLAKTKTNSVSSLMLLARWCKRRKMLPEAQHVCRMVLKLSPKHREAKAILAL